MVITDNYTNNKEATHNLGIKNEILLAVESFFISHPDNVEEHEWSMLALQILSIINTQRLK